MEYNWKLIRICNECGKEYEQDLENYLRQGIRAQRLVIPELVLIQAWGCSDCVLSIAKKE